MSASLLNKKVNNPEGLASCLPAPDVAVLVTCAPEVVVANPRRTRLIYACRRKTDEVDAESLARLARVDPKLLYPLKHRGEDLPGSPGLNPLPRGTACCPNALRIS
jgi:hypothetical protein